ncbi:MAG: insulinase family protein [Muribaculaceae bacterium]|nr:insulinase family protein [Muribaculaceae bacterium]
MIQFNKFTFDNGLRLIHHHNAVTSMVAVNLLYDVGSSDEDCNKTGLAHLMEHLMFSRTKHITKFDDVLTGVGGNSNAWTNIDVTDYYEELPAVNLETALWLESERLLNLDLTDENIEVQKSVVIEEFKQRYLNQPYGDILHLMHGQAYQKHPYQWPTIGKDVDTIKSFTRDDVIDFHRRHYSVNNAVMCISGNVEFDEAVRLVEKWFGDIEGRPRLPRSLPQEPKQLSPRFMTFYSKVPNNMIFRSYHMCGRCDDDYQATDLLSDVLGNGTSSRFHRDLIQGTDMFSEVSASVLGSRDPGLFYIRACLAPGVDFEKANAAIDEVLNRLNAEGVTQHEVNKYVNKYISNKLFESVGYAEKASLLSSHELLWGADGINTENDRYSQLVSDDIQRVASQVLDANNCSTIFYGPDAN